MKVIDALREDKQTLSFEFFPPKTLKQEENLFQVIGQLKRFNPDFVSVTCGAFGTNRDKTVYWVEQIKNKFQIEPIAHITCVAETPHGIEQHLKELEKIDVKNILALRGDPPEGEKQFVPPEGGFHYARELVAFIKKKNPDFCVGVAGYPEGHRESPSIEKDTEYLRQKVDAGAEYIVTQLFFESDLFFRFLERCEKAKIEVPILPGIMQITSLKQIKKITEICGAAIPQKILDKLEEYDGDTRAVEEYGVELAVNLCKELKQAKIPGLHFFVLNKAEPISKVLNALR